MKIRIITAVIALLIFIPVLVFASVELFLGINVIKLAISLICAVAVYEACACVGVKKEKILVYPCIVLGILLTLTITDGLKYYAPFGMLLLFFMLFVGVFSSKKENFSAQVLLELFGFVFYVVSSLGALYLVYTRLDAFFFPFVFVGAWVTDTFAYFTGVFFGRHKLIPEVSPKKTVEGAVGGTLFCIIGFVVCGLIQGVAGKGLIILGALGFVAAIVAQLGDLSASLIKRQHGIKDYGKIFPGHGGILDRFDSILSVSVLLYLMTEINLGALII